MRRIARDELGIELGQKILRNPETQKQFEDFVRYVVQEGELRMGPWGIYRDALWSKLGSAIVIRQPNGEFVTFLEADKGNASRWDTLTEVNH